MNRLLKPLFQTIHTALLIVLTCGISFGQLQTKTKQTNRKIDSLLQQTSTFFDPIKDSLTIEELNQRALFLSNQSMKNAISTLDSALDLADKINTIDLKAVTYYNYGQVYEQHGQFANAEQYYLKWFNVRKAQSVEKYRWGMMGMREFYTRHIQIEKLTQFDDEWIELLDNEFDNGVETKYGYEASSYSVIRNLTSIGEIYQAEERFIHLLEKNQGVSDWLQGSNFYFSVHSQLMEIGDVKVLSDWYQRWFNALKEYNSSKDDSKVILSIISDKLAWSYPEVAIYLVDDLYAISTRIDGGMATRQFTDIWVPKLNAGLNEAENRLRKSNQKEFLQQVLMINCNAAANPLLNEQKELLGSYLKSIEKASQQYDSDIATPADEELIAFLRSHYDKAQSKKFKKALKKAIKQVS